MCGIFGLLAIADSGLTTDEVESILKRLWILSESRGKEAAGLAILKDESIQVYKQAISASEMIRTPVFRRMMDEALEGANGRLRRPVAIIGHSRLVTNGAQNTRANNQPVIAGEMAGIHNGIIVNVRALWDRFTSLERQSEVDTEILFRLIRHYTRLGGSLAGGVRQAYAQIRGVANIAVFLKDFNQALLATNNGSLYLCANAAGSVCLFASEEYILRRLDEKLGLKALLGGIEIQQVRPGRGLLIDLNDLTRQDFDLAPAIDGPPPAEKNGANRRIEELAGPEPAGGAISSLATQYAKTPPRWMIEEYERNKTAIARLRRCKRCVLPETMPFIDFDEEGVCIDCRRHERAKPRTYLGPEGLAAAVEPYRRGDGRPDCLVPISGGRDSCYTLHYFKKILKMNPLAYTYDWGMVTDLARRNISRMCASLGVEHILVSADITKKRRYIRQNVEAWLRKPELGIIPLFMAGDKHFFYHAHQLRRHSGIKLLVFAMNSLENTDFKTGFCGLGRCKGEGRKGGYDTPGSKGNWRLIAYYLKQFLANPRYLNSSLFDTFTAYLIYYLMPIHQDYMLFEDYIKWDERTIVETLLGEYDWEVSPDTTTTWRIGDGTVPFYNYIYYTVAGFTENETFRSNQVREGMITRTEALEFLERENVPRFESMAWYCDTIGVDLERALRVIQAVPKLYQV